MNENKEYITKEEAKGTINISADVIAAVAAAAAAWKLFREYTSTARDVEAWEQAEAARAAEALSEEKKG